MTSPIVLQNEYIAIYNRIYNSFTILIVLNILQVPQFYKMKLQLYTIGFTTVLQFQLSWIFDKSHRFTIYVALDILQVPQIYNLCCLGYFTSPTVLQFMLPWIAYKHDSFTIYVALDILQVRPFYNGFCLGFHTQSDSFTSNVALNILQVRRNVVINFNTQQV